MGVTALPENWPPRGTLLTKYSDFEWEVGMPDFSSRRLVLATEDPVDLQAQVYVIPLDGERFVAVPMAAFTFNQADLVCLPPFSNVATEGR